jgi:hypothetical protein
VPGQILGTLERTRAVGGQSRTAHRQQPLAEQTHRARRRHRVGAVAHRQVDSLAVEIDDAIVGGYEHVDGRVAGAKAGQARNQPYGGERLIGRNGQRQSFLLAADLGDRLRELVQDVPGGRLQDLAGIGQPQLAVPSLEQREAYLLFERLHLAGERRLRQKQFLRGAGERELARRRLEAFEQVERRKARPSARLR